MELHLNRILSNEQIADILNTVFINRPIKILKTIARTGKNFSSVPWVYYQNEITEKRFATFISFNDLLQNFWVWLESVQIFALTVYQRQAISNVVWNYINVGDHVYSQNHGWATVIEKQKSISLKLKYFWLELENDFRIEKEEPCYLEIF